MTNLIESQLREAFANSFMQPECFRGKDIAQEILDSGLDFEENGMYTRLSASGFLDCTDWHGPFKTVEDAAACLLEAYADE